MAKGTKNRAKKRSPPNRAESCGSSPDLPRPGGVEKIASHIPLPVLPGQAGRVRPSRASRWRAFSLFAVHVLMIAHFVSWMVAGESVTPVEPSESMETITTGRINAGFIFFAAALAATLILGRWVCGWGCHLVAYQDLTLWVFKKLKLRPKAFRSRLLLFAPLAAAFYMFFWPEVLRLWARAPRPPTTWHLTTTGFWDTFPQYGIAILTVLSCGVAIIYFLGPKGFCTYACPYGALFALTDKAAVGRIRVTDACRQCGHCTSVCTSNVKVAEEVHRYGMVVDPGCMKCLDCVTVCPNDALYFGIGRPSLLARTSLPGRAIRWDLSWGEDVLALLIGVAAFLCYRGFLGKVPFLMSVGLAGVAVYLFMKAVKLLYARDVLIQRTRLKAAGHVTPIGVAYVAAMFAIAVATAYCGLWRYHDWRGGSAFAHSPPETFRWQYDEAARGAFGESTSSHAPGPRSQAQRAAIRDGLHHLERARSLAFYPVMENDLELAWLYVRDGQPDRAAEAVRRAIDMSPESPTLWMHLAKIETARGSLPGAREAFDRALALDEAARAGWHRKLPDRPMAHSATIHAEHGMFLAYAGDVAAGLEHITWATRYDPASAPAWVALATVQMKLDEVDAARQAFIEAARHAPSNPDAMAALHDLRKSRQNFAAAAREYESALLDAKHPLPALRHNLAYALTELGRLPEAIAAYRALLEGHPRLAEARAELGAVLLVTGDAAGAVREYEIILEHDPRNAEAALRAGFICAQLERTEEAARRLRDVIEHGSPDQREIANGLLRELGK